MWFSVSYRTEEEPMATAEAIIEQDKKAEEKGKEKQ